MSHDARARTLLDRLTAWSPVLLLGGLAALTFWLDAQVQPPPARRDGSQRHDPDLYVENFRAVELDARGLPKQIIAGKRAVHFGDDQTTEVIEPLLAQTEAGKPAIRITAAKGTLSGDRKEAWFTGNVRATQEAGATRTSGDTAGPVTLSTEYLYVVPATERATTDKPVTIEEPRGIIRATGLALDNKAKTLKLEAGVSGTLQPGALPATAAPVRSTR